jgi:hypothetical protein
LNANSFPENTFPRAMQSVVTLRVAGVPILTRCVGP